MVGRRGAVRGATALLAGVWFGVAVSTGPVQAQSILRIINNSETESAEVQAHYFRITDGSSGVLTLRAGRYQVTTECSGGTPCIPQFFAEIRVNGVRLALPEPTEALDLRLDEAGGPRRVEFPTCTNPCNGIGGLGGGRFTFRPTAVVTAEGSGDRLRLRVSADVSTLRVLGGASRLPPVAPEDNEGRGNEGGAGGGAGQP